MPPPPIPHKPLGKFYAIVLRQPDFSHANVALRGGLGGSDHVPVPSFGAPCVCCDGDPRGRTQPVELTDPGGHFSAEPVEVPICAACADHATERTGASVLAACLLCVSIPLSLLGFLSYDLPALGLGGLGLTALVLTWLARTRSARLQHTRGGHHPGLSLLIAPRQCVVRTPNRALAERLVAANEPLVSRVR